LTFEFTDGDTAMIQRKFRVSRLPMRLSNEGGDGTLAAALAAPLGNR
jgi:hypothetical protein